MTASHPWPAGKVLGLRIAALIAVSLWGLFALLYLGVEDGSSGLSPLGNLTLAFFLPGLLLMQLLEGAHSNSDVPLMAFVGWLGYAIAGQAAVTVVLGLRARLGPTTHDPGGRA